RSFRPELLYRINVVTLRVLPLRERSADIPALAEYFLQAFCDSYDRNVKPLSAGVMRSMIAYSWPGNIRELENLMKRYVIFGCEDAICDELRINVDLRPVQEAELADPVSLKQLTKDTVRELERKTILKALHANHWNRKRAARALNI